VNVAVAVTVAVAVAVFAGVGEPAYKSLQAPLNQTAMLMIVKARKYDLFIVSPVS
jgi:hypothetical protein